MGFKDGSIIIWNINTNELKKNNDIQAPITYIQYNKVKKYFIATVASNLGFIYDLKGNQIYKLHPPEIVYSVCFSPDGNFLLLGHNPDITLSFLNIEKSILYGNKDYIWDCCFSPDGKYFATASYDYTSCLWDIKGNLLSILRGHSDKLRDVEFSIDGKYILTASFDKTARIWDLDGNCLSVLNHQAEVNEAIFSHDNKFIATACFDGSIGLWSKTGKLINWGI